MVHLDGFICEIIKGWDYTGMRLYRDEIIQGWNYTGWDYTGMRLYRDEIIKGWDYTGMRLYRDYIIQGWDYTGIILYRDEIIQGWDYTGIILYRDEIIQGWDYTGMQGQHNIKFCARSWIAAIYSITTWVCIKNILNKLIAKQDKQSKITFLPNVPRYAKDFT